MECLWNVNPRPFQGQGGDLQKPVRHAAKFILVCPLSTELHQCENFIGNLWKSMEIYHLPRTSTTSTLAVDDVHKKWLCESARILATGWAEAR